MRKKYYLSLLLLFLFHIGFVIGQHPTVQTQKLVATIPQINATYGQSVAISDNYMIVGAYLENTVDGNNAGAAYIYELVSGVWTFRQRILASDASMGDRFGASVAITDNYAVVGATDAGAGGKAYAFRRNGPANWVEEEILIPSDISSSDEFGESVDVDGINIIVGAPRKNSYEGAAYVFRRQGVNDWTQQIKLTAITPTANDHFGHSVGISGTRVIVGAFGDDEPSESACGAAYIFTRGTPNWTTTSQTDRILASDLDGGDQFGYSVAISGNYAIIGAYTAEVGSDNNAGAAYVFNYTTSWTQQTILTASDYDTNDYFGDAVDISTGGNYAIVGAYGKDGGVGGAYVFSRSGSTWTEVGGPIEACNRGADDDFGSAVAISNNYAVVGATNEDTNGDDAGAAYVFADASPTPQEINVLGINTDIVDGDLTPDVVDGTDYGFLVVGGTASTPFRINNEGGQPLNITNIAVSGSTDFTLTSSTLGTVPGCGFTSFDVDFIPSSTGIKTATVTIQSDDADEGTYTFNIQGTGVGTYYSIGDGNWDNPAVWATTSGGSTCSCTPTVGSTVVIEGGHTITQNQNNQLDNTNIVIGTNNGSGILELDLGTYTNNPVASITTSATNATQRGIVRLQTGDDLDVTNNNFYINDFATVEYVGAGYAISDEFAGEDYPNLTIAGIGIKTLSDDTDIVGSLTINSGTTLDVTTSNHDIEIEGNWINNGIFDGRSGTVTFSGSSPQTLEGVTTFSNLVINNIASSAANRTVTFNAFVQANNSLNLQNGRVILAVNNFRYSGTDGNLTHSPTSWVQTGSNVFLRGAASPATFPVGSSTQKQAIQLSTAITGSSVRFGTPSLGMSGVGSWFVGNGTTTADITLLNPQGTLGASPSIHKYNTPTASTWNPLTTTGSPNYTATSAYTGSSAEFSIFTPATTYYSIAGAVNWNNTSSWTLGSCGTGTTPATPPTASDNVVICAGSTVTNDIVGGASCANLTVNGTLQLSGNDFTVSGTTTISGTGTIDDNNNAGTNTFGIIDNSGTFQNSTAIGNFTYIFNGNITNTGTFALTSGNPQCQFNSNLTITNNAASAMSFASSAGTGSCQINANVTINGSSAADIILSGGVNVSLSNTLTNNNSTGRLTTSTIIGGGTLQNNGRLNYASSSEPTVTEFFNNGGSTFIYSAGGDIRATAPSSSTYHNVEFSGSGTTTSVLLGDIEVGGDLTIGANRTLVVGNGTNDYNIDIKGKWINNGMFTPSTVTPSSPATVQFNGTAPQTLEGATTFHNLIINNSAGVELLDADPSPPATLATPVTVSNALTLTDGKLRLNANDITYGSSTNPVVTNGWVETNGSGSFVSQTGASSLFPVGDDTNYQPLDITGIIAGVSVRFTSPSVSVPAAGAGAWRITTPSTGFPYTFLFENPQGGGISPSSEIHRLVSGSWIAATTSFVSPDRYQTTYTPTTSEELAVFTPTPDYTITTTTNDVTITDNTGNGEILTISEPSTGNIRFANSNTAATYSINGGTSTTFTTPADIPLAGITSITINAEAGNDFINTGAFSAMPSLTINGGRGDDRVNFNGNITFVANANLDVDLQDDPTPVGVDRVNFDANMTLSGTGSIDVKTSELIRVSSANLTTDDGNITLEANQQASPTSGNFIGVQVATGSNIRTTGTGDITIRGKGGNTGSSSRGVSILNDSRVEGNIVNIEGEAGNADDFNYGIRIQGPTLTEITSRAGTTISGTGGGTGASQTNRGIFFTEGLITATGGNITVSGTGGSGSGGNHVGIEMDNGARITSAATGGNITVSGTGGSGGNDNHGIVIGASSTINHNNTSGGTVTVTGTAGSTNADAADILLQNGGRITSVSTTNGTVMNATTGGFSPFTAPVEMNINASQELTFGASSSLNFRINGTMLNTDYQQLTLNGRIDLNNATLNTYKTNTFTPNLADEFIIIENDGTDPITGTFNGLAPGDIISNFLGSGLNAQITYAGGSGNDVVLTVVPPPLPTQPSGNRGMYFDGVDDYVEIPTSSMDFAGNEAYTIETWVKVSRLKNFQPIFTKRGSDAGDHQIHLRIDEDGRVEFRNDRQSMGGWDSRATAPGEIEINKWYHIAVVSNGSGVKKIFINGLDKPLNNNSLPTATNQYLLANSSGEPWFLGTDAVGVSMLEGQLDEFRIFAGVRGAGQIQTDMGSNVAGTAIGYWNFNDGTGTNADDLGSGNNDGTLTGATGVPLWALRVTNTNDTGVGSLRNTIDDGTTDGANNLAGKNYIDFSIDNVSGAQTITLATPLPQITESLILDGTSEFDYTSYDPQVYITTAASSSGVVRINNASDCEIYGLQITYTGSATGVDGIYIVNSASNNVFRIGAVDKGNIINGFLRSGIFVSGINNGFIQGNRIGTNVSGNAASSPVCSKGIWFNNNTNNNLIGGSNTGEGNLISGNSEEGIYITSSTDNQIIGNLIGTQADGITPLGNDDRGINILGPSLTPTNPTAIISQNTIAHNTDKGIRISQIDRCRISQNSIYNNNSGGINLTGSPVGNNDKDAPIINSATTALIQGTCEAGDVIEVFTNNSGETQGRTYLADATVSGTTWTLTGSFAAGDVTATATDASGNTSEFSAAVPISASITLGIISSTSFCAGSTIDIPFTTMGTFGAGNTFTAELSDASGSFIAPVTLGSGMGSPISGTIPVGIGAGTGYQVRVVSSAPVLASNEANISIGNQSAPTTSPMPDVVRQADQDACYFTNTTTTNQRAISISTVTSSCGGVTYQYDLTGATTGNFTSLSGVEFNIGITRVSWRASTGGGTTSTDEFTVTVIDQTSPTLIAPSDTTIQAALYSCQTDNTIDLNLTPPISSDNCLFRVFNDAPVRFPIGQTTVIWTAIDSAGNETSDEQLVSVIELRDVQASDSLALVAIYNQTGGANWVNSWDLNTPVYTWYGVSTSCGRVTRLDLADNNLRGTLPTNVLNLSRRTESDFSLDISRNILGFESAEDYVSAINNFNYTPQAKIYRPQNIVLGEGEEFNITSETPGDFNTYQWYKNGVAIAGATDAELIIEKVLVTDAGVYHCLVKNTRATRLALERHIVTLTVEGFVEPLDSLALVQLFEGTAGSEWSNSWNLNNPVATWEGVLLEGNKVRELDLSSQNLSGNLPDVFGADIFSELRYLSLFDNQLEGQIPPSIGQLSTLTYLDLDQNQFVGQVPASFGNLVNLQALWLSRNNLTSLPNEIGKLQKLKRLYLNSNQFESLPEAVGELRELLILNISDNELQDFPISITNLSKLRELYANRNDISLLPEDLQKLIALVILEFNTNELTDLPEGLLTLNNLKELHISENELTFEDLLPLLDKNYEVFDYSPQARIDEELEFLVEIGTDLSLQVSGNATGNRYEWRRDGELVSSLQNFSLSRISGADAGAYIAYITNAQLPDLELERKPILVKVTCTESSDLSISIPRHTTFCSGQPFGLRLAIEQELVGDVRINWRKDGILLAFSNRKSITVTQAGKYSAEVVTDGNCTARSNEVEISVNPQPEVSIELNADTVLVSNITTIEDVTYQWLKDGESIGGATQGSFKPETSGEYSLLVLTSTGCTTTSRTISITIDVTTGTSEPIGLRNLELFPNPNNGQFMIDFGGSSPNGNPKFILLNAIGQQINIQAKRITTNRYQINTKKLSGGLYFLKINTKDGSIFRKFIIEE